MPSIASSSADLARFARVWRSGNKVFNQMVEVLALREGQTYNHMTEKEPAPPRSAEAFSKVNGREFLAFINSTRERTKAYHAKISLIMALGEELEEKE